MHAVETTVAKATRGQTKFKLIIETAE